MKIVVQKLLNLDAEVAEYLAKWAKKNGYSQTFVIEMALRIFFEEWDKKIAPWKK